MPAASGGLQALFARLRFVADPCPPGANDTGSRLMPTLDQVAAGRRCRIESVTGSPTLVQRLLELGVMAGEDVIVINKAPLGDPIEIECALTRLSLRKSEAAHVLITLLD
jgi:ferrous iron transport protein A